MTKIKIKTNCSCGKKSCSSCSSSSSSSFSSSSSSSSCPCGRGSVSSCSYCTPRSINNPCNVASVTTYSSSSSSESSNPCDISESSSSCSQQIALFANAASITALVPAQSLIVQNPNVTSLYTISVGALQLPFGVTAAGYLSSYVYVPGTQTIIPCGTFGIGVSLLDNGTCFLNFLTESIAIFLTSGYIAAVSASNNYVTTVPLQIRFLLLR